MQGVGIGIISNCAGLYYDPICKELGFSMGKLTFYKTISGFFAILSLTVVPKLVKQHDIRIVSFALIVMAGGANLLMAFSSKLWHWYLLGALQGCALTGFSHFLPVTILNNWFSKKNGFALGLSCATSGALGSIMSRILSMLIARYGWRMSAFVNGLFCIAICAPFLLIFLRYRPEDLGMKPYGYDKASQHPSFAQTTSAGNSYSTNAFGLAFWVVMLFSVSAKSIVGFAQYLSGYGSSLGYPTQTASLILTLYLLGNVCFKLLFGYLNDRLGVLRSSDCELLTLLLGCTLLLSKSQSLIFIGAALYGTCAMLSNVQYPLLVRSLWSKETFPKVYAKISIAADVGYYLSISAFGFLYDATKRYEPGIIVCIVLTVLCLLLVNSAYRRPGSKQ